MVWTSELCLDITWVFVVCSYHFGLEDHCLLHSALHLSKIEGQEMSGYHGLGKWLDVKKCLVCTFILGLFLLTGNVLE